MSVHSEHGVDHVERHIPEPGKVFINMPYDKTYEERLVAFIASLALYGVIPTAAVAAGTAPNRLQRIIDALTECTLSVHDLSVVGSVDGAPDTPRLNMAFELGLAIALSPAARNTYVVFDTVPFRVDRALSDARGLDAEIHDGTPQGVFRAMTNIFYREDFQPEPADFEAVNKTLQDAARALHQSGYTSLFASKPFDALRRIAAQSASEIRKARLFHRIEGDTPGITPVDRQDT